MVFPSSNPFNLQYRIDAGFVMKLFQFQFSQIAKHNVQFHEKWRNVFSNKLVSTFDFGNQHVDYTKSCWEPSGQNNITNMLTIKKHAESHLDKIIEQTSCSCLWYWPLWDVSLLYSLLTLWISLAQFDMIILQ